MQRRRKSASRNMSEHRDTEISCGSTILSRPLNVAGPEAAVALVSDGSVVVLGAGTCGQ
jgi:hypothetical protein